MPSATARRHYEDQIPSFMSIFDPDADGNIDARGLVTMVDTKMMGMEPSCAPAQLPNGHGLSPQHALRSLPGDPAHRHHDSTSTHNSESADSSPTTTLTTDTSSLSDPSPSSSPDSPVNLIPLNSFPATTFGGLPSTMNNLTVNDSAIRERPMTSPSPRRARNMKGLSIQPPFATSLSTSLISEPSSPSFIKPKIPAMKRKPSQLSLKTDSTGLNIRPAILEVPCSPALPPILQRRSLKHSTSSPHMLSGLKSATFGPAGGMTFPTVLERGTSGLSELLRPSKHGNNGMGFDTTILEEDSPIKTQLANRAAMDFEPFIEPENNEDQKSPGYPDGPIAIYGDNVYLYLEPTAEEASKFDVVINVAREVHNPFEATTKEKSPAGTNIVQGSSPIPDTAMTNDSFATAFEFPLSDGNRMETPTTPKPNPISEPEYIHMPWDHNTNIATDLMMLCETIENRTKDGKKVLVHCQQGASRSASLIIAYGLYQNPGLTVNDAYYAAQAKSRWVSPNMRLMYCLQDFQKEVTKRKMPLRSAVGPRSGRSPTKHHRLTLSANAIEIQPKEPLTAPLPDEKQGATHSSSPDRGPSHFRGKSTPNLESISPGPSSAPSTFSWSEKEDEKDPGKPGRFNFGDSLEPPRFFEPLPEPQSGHTALRPPPSPGFFQPCLSPSFRPPPSPGFAPKHFVEGHQSLGFSSMDLRTGGSFLERRKGVEAERELAMAPALPDDDALMSPRAETMTNNPLRDSYSELAGMKFVEVPPTPSEGLFSPRQTMFPRDPFYPFGRPPHMADPRSPPTKGETPIVRSIDDVL
ncbi:dual specificity phosphatase [Durotheca rogersii]|uniref:dual specificity phosphatase n=1 Tax=Durotheca rogersii TaxID=419775 RepID=UPI00221E4393|nr:dual specificity phosphatase [Durotheca rogersii]KAI5859329.1 dual specificity phosphatase [Durotheca rogersii]